MLLCEAHCPAVEVGCFKVIAVEHLLQNSLVASVAESVSKLWVGIGHGLQIRHVIVFPAGGIIFCHATTTFRETAVTHFAFVGKHLSCCLSDSKLCVVVRDAGDTLVALTVVIGAYIVERMILMILPCYYDV